VSVESFGEIWNVFGELPTLNCSTLFGAASAGSAGMAAIAAMAKSLFIVQ